MKTMHTHALELSGSSYEAGRLLGGSCLASVPSLKKRLRRFPRLRPDAVNQASQCFSRWCPGLNEELAGFADAWAAPLSRFSLLRHDLAYTALQPPGPFCPP